MADINIEVVYDGLCCGCMKSFDDNIRTPNKLTCNHFICSFCLPTKKRSLFMLDFYSCGLCRDFNAPELVKGTKFVVPKQRINDLTIEVENTNVRIEELEKTIIKMEDDAERASVGHVKCCECGNKDNETNMQVCDSCTMNNCESIEQYATNAYLEDSDINSIAICAVCAIRSHIKKGHEVSDFFPILSSVQYAIHSEKLRTKREMSKKENKSLKRNMDEMMRTINAGEKELDRMTDMIKRQRSSESQQQMFSNVSLQIEKNKCYVKELNSFMESHEKAMKKMIAELRDVNDENDPTKGEKHQGKPENLPK